MDSQESSPKPELGILVRSSKAVWKLVSALFKFTLRIGKVFCRGVVAFLFTIKEDLRERASAVPEPGSEVCEQVVSDDTKNTIKPEDVISTETCKIADEFDEIINGEKDGVKAIGDDTQEISKKKKKSKKKKEVRDYVADLEHDRKDQESPAETKATKTTGSKDAGKAIENAAVSKSSEQISANKETKKAENAKKKNAGNATGTKKEGPSKAEMSQKTACETSKKGQKKAKKTAQNLEVKAPAPANLTSKKSSIATEDEQKDSKSSLKTIEEAGPTPVRTQETDVEQEFAMDDVQKEARRITELEEVVNSSDVLWNDAATAGTSRKKRQKLRKAAQATSNMPEPSNYPMTPPASATTGPRSAKESIPALMDIPITPAWGDLSNAGAGKQPSWAVQPTTSIPKLMDIVPTAAWSEIPAAATTTQSSERLRKPGSADVNPWTRGNVLTGNVAGNQGAREDIVVTNSPTPEEAAELSFQEVGGRKRKQKESKQNAEAEKSQMEAISRVSPTSSLGSMEGAIVPKKPFKKQLTVEGTGPVLAAGKSLPKRPDRGGRIGNPITVHVNCWEARIADMSIYMYDIEALKLFKIADGKKIEMKFEKPKALREFLRPVIDRFPGDTFYDGGRIVYSIRPLKDVSTAGLIREESVPDPTNQDELFVKYTIKRVGEVSSGALASYVANPNACTFNIPQDSINMLDCAVKWINRVNFLNFGKTASFCPQPLQEVRNKLFVIHRGFFASLRPQWKVRLNIDMVHKAFFPSGNLADILHNKYGDNMFSHTTWRAMSRDIELLRVEASHYKNEQGKGYSRRFTVYGLSQNAADAEMIDNMNVSIADYFAERYSIHLKYPKLPCVRIKPKLSEYMPMELLYVLPYQLPKADKADIASEIIRCSSVRPQDRFFELDHFVKDFVRKQHRLARDLHLDVSAVKPTDVPARVLPQPQAIFHGQTTILGRGKWNPAPFYRPVGGPTLKWAILAVPPDRMAPADSRMLQEELPKSSAKLGVHLDPSPLVKTITLAQLRYAFEEFRKKGIELAVIILYDNRSYSTIKRLGDLELGMKTQCVKNTTLRKPNVMLNLMLKINGKLGGINWSVKQLQEENLLMVMGADVTHPAATKADRLQKSVAAVIGSLSPDLMRYAAVIRQQDTRERADKATRELIDSMDTIVTDLLKAFGQFNNNRLPNRIIFYRDGVSEGQFQSTLVSELTAIQRACRLLKQDYEPGITFIVVQKRHHVRFQPLDPRMRNVEPGTVVDQQVTHPREFDFYLCSQEGIQGTTKPAHYHVLYDDNNWSSDALQCFTYYLCHAYMRCCRSVSYPAPTFYSHLAAFRARDWLKDTPRPEEILQNNKFKLNPSQQNAMFFL